MSTYEPPFQLDYIYVEALAVKLARVERPFKKKADSWNVTKSEFGNPDSPPFYEIGQKLP